MSNTSDERLEELIRWTGHGDMPDMHALLLDLRRHREAQRPVSDGDLTDEELQRWLQSVPCARYGPRDMQRIAREIVRRRAVQAVDTKRVRAVVREAIHGMNQQGTLHAHQDAITDRVAAQLGVVADLDAEDRAGLAYAARVIEMNMKALASLNDATAREFIDNCENARRALDRLLGVTDDQR